MRPAPSPHLQLTARCLETPGTARKGAEEEIKRREKSAEWWKTKFKSFLLPVGSGRVTWLQDVPGGGRRSPAATVAGRHKKGSERRQVTPTSRGISRSI